MVSECLQQVDWNYELAYLSVEESYMRFVGILLELVNLYVPVDEGTQRVPWCVRPPRQLVRQRTAVWENYKSLRSLHGRGNEIVTDALREFNILNHQC